MGAADDAVSQLQQAIVDWDFTPAFPSNYPSDYGVIVYTSYPWSLLGQIDPNVVTDSTYQMQQYLITILDLNSPEVAARLGDVFGPGSDPGTNVYGKRMTCSILVQCWADQRLGGLDVARKLGAQIYGCAQYNQNRLAGLRHLRVTRGVSAYDDGAQLYHYDVTITGDGIVAVEY